MRITIQEIFDVLGINSDAPNTSLEPITNFKQAHQNALFFAIQSPYGKGWEQLDEVRNNGVQWAVVPENIEGLSCQGLNLIPVPDPIQLLGQLARKHLNYPPNLIAVTGTNGKSSISYYCAQLSQQVGLHSGIIGTFGVGPLEAIKPSPRTTPDIIYLHHTMNDMALAEVKTVAFEASSEGLDQRRLEGIPVEVAIFTNFSRDHLNYHNTMEAYLSAKKKLFSHPDLKLAVINIDDPFAESMIEGKDYKCYRYSLIQPDADFFANILSYEADYQIIDLHTPIGNQLINLPLLGDFNTSNALAALAALWDSIEDKTALIQALSFLHGAPGRMQQIKLDKQPLVVVDYAHTPDALEVSLRALGQHTSGKIYCVFGCGGDRDKGKRPLMTEAALMGSDVVILTTDNPRFEDPLAIINDACELISPEVFAPQSKLQRYVDRREAIEKAINQAGPEDTILIAGKGHETYQEVCGVKHHFNDVEEAQCALNKRAAHELERLLEPAV
ncbi:UDP-N-acetylmuramoyl-L-alanyl-D-glutamate--2,6-diaminopimelate ligase [Litoribrevibacter albus]|uniref:UDP-N-acetylmuramoyl-L-alanyl-D-glutamate--2,6-diaminopimelate ligase n=1 Tax=Litoribrevibacter albus TaxID=1473156 RepID=A0AA37W5S4_9GAMM|nr:UDP-N-acetylmuramoyl-L-alanyl-D-glutamate--2,6-diaminopimelate ligase [Litoribrevibacter albus]GLQ30880.1 UDP-N-acetylmuramoyl-L-alanyl-D-glutamate--2,6-diaminopimelate ligase [Litoribrevibacter albus]